MTPTLITVHAQLEEPWLDTLQLCRLAGVSEAWLQERVTLGLLQVSDGGDVQAWRFATTELRRACRIAEVERTFEAVPELAALVADLEDELARLRARLHRQGPPA